MELTSFRDQYNGFAANSSGSFTIHQNATRLIGGDNKSRFKSSVDSMNLDQKKVSSSS